MSLTASSEYYVSGALLEMRLESTSESDSSRDSLWCLV